MPVTRVISVQTLIRRFNSVFSLFFFVGFRRRLVVRKLRRLGVSPGRWIHDQCNVKIRRVLNVRSRSITYVYSANTVRPKNFKETYHPVQQNLINVSVYTPIILFRLLFFFSSSLGVVSHTVHGLKLPVVNNTTATNRNTIFLSYTLSLPGENICYNTITTSYVGDLRLTNIYFLARVPRFYGLCV